MGGEGGGRTGAATHGHRGSSRWPFVASDRKEKEEKVGGDGLGEKNFFCGA